MSNYHKSYVTNILLKHWENHYLEIVKEYPGPETRPSSLFGRSRLEPQQHPDRNQDKTGTKSGSE
jgi:hypothetical protein